MKKVVTILTIVAVLSGVGMIAFSQCKRPVNMNKTEKIQKNIKESKEEAKKKAEEQAKQENKEDSSQSQNSN